MKLQQLTSSERKELKKLRRPALKLALGFFVFISVINLILSFPDVVLGLETKKETPISQLIIIESAAFIIALAAFYFPSKQVSRDLAAGQKHTDDQEVIYKFVKNNNGGIEYTFRLKNSFVIPVDIQLYKSVTVGDVVEIGYVPSSLHVFDVNRVS